MSTLENLLQGNEYKINTTKQETYELFFVHGKVETVRSTETTATSVTLYVDHDGKKGSYTFKVFPSDTDEILRNKIESGKKQALLVFDEPYSLPENESAHTVLSSSLANCSMAEVGRRIASAVFKANAYEGGSLNAVEIFLYKEEVIVKNSAGIDKSEIKYRAMIEAIPTWNENGESVELYEAYHFTELDEEDITAEIDRKMQEVRDRYHAVKPETELTVPVVLNAGEISSLFKEIVHRNLNYADIYSHSGMYEKGDDVQKRTDGDEITLELRREVKGSPFSATFDGNGTTLKDKTLIEKGKVVGYFGSFRYAQYLGEEPTGDLGCTYLHAGSVEEDELAKTPHFECVSMSGLQVDGFNDYIGGEVRLAYLVDGEKKIPLTGVSISGKLSEVLSSIRFTKETKAFGSIGYEGPIKAILKNVKIF